MARNLAVLLFGFVCLLTGYALGFATGRGEKTVEELITPEPEASKPARTGKIKIESKPMGARVSVDGEVIRLGDGMPAQTPIEALTQLQYGKTYEIRLDKEGYEPWVESFEMNELVDGRSVEAVLRRFERTIEPPPAEPDPAPPAERAVAVAVAEDGMALLTVNTRPPSVVHLDEEQLGLTPITARKIKVGEHRLRMVFSSLGGHEELRVINAREKTHLQVHHDMRREDRGATVKEETVRPKSTPGCESIPGRVGEVMLTADEIAEVHVGGERKGTTPLKLQLAAGCQIVEAISVNRGTRTRVKLDVKPGETTRHRFRF